MNKARLLELADAIERNDRFNMRGFFLVPTRSDKFDHDDVAKLEKLYTKDGEVPCGTTCCIAGEAAILSGKTEGEASEVAAEWLGLDYDEAINIFYGKWSPKGLSATAEEAVAYLRQLAESAT